ncbi:hypothetical protein MIND_00782900 [Mycena indigotica]|uniref:F-box domain-containing protein n=1 Tax=Mycena indigotica TaxID=2126181 RepID=A0A8H6SNL4_9AGAR|nr:uncharacterized protein MIND_00782900 [Mycena indigotica]KAF7302160.1 hypothetical protein MIND_00782900 [Mycena indigotica]
MWSWLIPIGLAAWMASNVVRGRQRRPKTQRIHLEDLNDDVLRAIFSKLHPIDRIIASSVSRRIRTTLVPDIFWSVQWQPPNQSLPSKNLLPYVRTFKLSGNLHDKRQYTTLVNHTTHEAIVAQLNNALPQLTLLSTFILGSFMLGGLSSEIMKILTRLPTLQRLTLDASWLNDSPFILNPGDCATTLKFIQYTTTYLTRSSDHGVIRRSPRKLQIEASNMRHLLAGCHSTLEGIVLPGELLIRAVDISLQWTALRELVVIGLWPEDVDTTFQDGRSQMLQVLEALPNLYLIRLGILAQINDPQDRTNIIGLTHAPPHHPASFLRNLRIFKLSSPTEDEQILAFLPSSLECLAFPRYPIERMLDTRTVFPPCSRLVDILNRGHFPSLETLDLIYVVSSMADVEAEGAFVSSLPSKHPNLYFLSIQRLWNHHLPELEDHWEPVPKFRTLLSRLKRLRQFKFNASVPERFGRFPFSGLLEDYHEHIDRLEVLACAITSECPWLEDIAMYRELGSNVLLYWSYWDMVVDDDGTPRLQRRQHPIPRSSAPRKHYQVV